MPKITVRLFGAIERIVNRLIVFDPSTEATNRRLCVGMLCDSYSFVLRRLALDISLAVLML